MIRWCTTEKNTNLTNAIRFQQSLQCYHLIQVSC